MPASPVSREDLRRALVVNAATKPVNVAAPAAVAVAAAALGAAWLLLVAVVVFVALSALTFFDEDEAAAVGRRLYAARRAAPALPDAPEVHAPPVARRLEAALAAREEIHAAIADSSIPLHDLAGEVDGLVAALPAIARRADRAHRYLAEHPAAGVERRLAALREAPGGGGRTVEALEQQRRSVARLEHLLDRCYAEMDGVVAALQAIHAETVAMGAAGATGSDDALTGRVGDLQDRVRALSAGVEEAYDETRMSPPRRPIGEDVGRAHADPPGADPPRGAADRLRER